MEEKTTIKDFPFSNLLKVDEDDDEDDELEVNIKRFSRSVLKVTIKNGGETIDVYAAHLKAKLPTKVKNITKKHQGAIGSAVSTIRRTAEAAALRWELTNAMKGNSNPVVLMGDLNDDPRSNTLAIITEQPTMSAKSSGRDTALYSTLQLEQLKSFRDVFYTHDYNNTKDTLDHILVSKEFFAPRAKWKHKETKIWNDYIEDDDGASSDHGIIKTSFK